jgi:hypothetical protein
VGWTIIRGGSAEGRNRGYLEQHSAARWPAIVYWLMVIVSPYAYYRYRDETFVACIAVLMVMTAMMLGN